MVVRMEDVYNKNYLKKVILRIDFPSTPLDIEENIPSSLLDIIIQKYPVFEVKEKLEKQYKITFKTDSMDIDKSDIIKEFLYYTNDKKKLIIVSKKYIHFEYMIWDKNTYKELEGTFKSIISSLFGIKDINVTRIGLRYINHITLGSSELAPIEWDNYLNPNIISIFKVAENGFQISRAFQTLELMLSDIRIRFQYGMHNPDYPAPIRKRLFILDYDGYCELLQSQSELIENLGKINREIEKLFKNSIGPLLDSDMKRGGEN
jgi:uncharacterized protein (TIGR04255 family)